MKKINERDESVLTGSVQKHGKNGDEGNEDTKANS
jgi:hypothetical protein